MEVVRFWYPKVKIFGLLFIWTQFVFKQFKLFKDADIVHVHDVFIWYLPLKLLFPRKIVFVTHHGWEGKFPIPFWNKLNKKISNKLTNGSICVGDYIEKYYGIKCDEVVYGGVEIPKNVGKKKKGLTVFLGRLEKDTGLLKFLKKEGTTEIDSEIIFVGDGSLRKECEKVGKVVGFTNPKHYLEKAETVISSGYLSCLEAFSYKCKVKVFWDNELKKDYWKNSPFWEFIEKEDVKGASEWVKMQTWGKLSEIYESLY